MGEVYRARDSGLERNVAIKVLPDEVAQDPDRLARFGREAKLLASLSHQNIATLFGLEEHEGRRFLVMELAEGETLAERIKRGPIPVDDVLGIAVQLAEGLEAAHERGIIHRDLKPANVMLSSGDRVKILDFGLAKAWQAEDSDADLTHSPTLTAQMTTAGVLLGTAAYMSPEQARGKPVDKRADIWAFGVVLWEMLTGRRLFSGNTVTDVLASVLKDTPDLDALPAATPPRLAAVIGRCLKKETRARLQHIGDARIELEQPTPDSVASQQTVDHAPKKPWLWAALLVAFVVVAYFAGRLTRPTHGTEEGRTTTLSIIPPDDVALVTECGPNTMVLSPDGRTLVFVGETESGSRLYRRDFEAAEIHAIPNTAGALGVTFSPNGQKLGFITEKELRVVTLDGSDTRLVSSLVGPDFVPSFYYERSGLSWGDSGDIVLGGVGGLFRFPENGGPGQVLLKGSEWWRFPQALTGGSVLITRDQGISQRSVVGRLQPGRGEFEMVVEPAFAGRLLPSGHLLYSLDSELYAVPVDKQSLEHVGPPRRVLEDAYVDLFGEPVLTFAADGTLAYLAGRPSNRLIWIDIEGRIQPLGIEPRGVEFPRISPDGTKIALSVVEGLQHAAHVYDIERRVLQLLVEGAMTDLPLWTEDGRIVFNAGRDREPWSLFWMSADGSGDMHQIVAAESWLLPTDVSSEGDVVYETPTGELWVTDISGEGEPTALVADSGLQIQGRFSSNAEYLVYGYQHRDRMQVFVRPVGRPGGVHQVSDSGGHDPLWSPDDTKIYYRNGRTIMVADFDPKTGMPGRPRDLFAGPPMGGYKYYRSWDIHPDGDRFIAVERFTGLTEIRVVQNWLEELRRLVPPEGG
jgi:serine/threonine-protein kinase